MVKNFFKTGSKNMKLKNSTEKRYESRNNQSLKEQDVSPRTAQTELLTSKRENKRNLYSNQYRTSTDLTTSHTKEKTKRIIEIPENLTDDEFKQLKRDMLRLIKKKWVLIPLSEAVKYQFALITEAVVYYDRSAYFRCPNCKTTLERDFQQYCDRCGQKLKWPSFQKVKYIYL